MLTVADNLKTRMKKKKNQDSEEDSDSPSKNKSSESPSKLGNIIKPKVSILKITHFQTKAKKPTVKGTGENFSGLSQDFASFDLLWFDLVTKCRDLVAEIT